MRAYTKGKGVLMAFEEDIGTALKKACKHDRNQDAVHVAHAAQIVRVTYLVKPNHLMVSLIDALTILCYRFCST